MKITFIQPYYENVWEALGIGYLIAFIREYSNEEHEINFFQAKFDSDADILSGAEDSDIVAFSCTSPAFSHGLVLANKLKQRHPKVHTVFGGWHPTALPKHTLTYDCVDQVIIGEGEMGMIETIRGSRRGIINGGNLWEDDFVWPDRQAIKNERTIALCETMNGKRTASFQFNRGCKVRCKFCAEMSMTGKYHGRRNPIRTRSYHDLLDEIMCVGRGYNLDYFKFVDSSFNKDTETVINFCEAKVRRGLELPWECNIHAAFAQKKEMFEVLAEANCKQINVGVESGSPKILKQIGKGTKTEYIKKIFRWGKEYGIGRRAFVVIGMPDETKEDLKLTEELIDEICPDVVGFTILAPYPGCQLYDHSKYKDIDYNNVDEYSNSFYRNKYFSNKELKEIQARFENKYSSILCERRQK